MSTTINFTIEGLAAFFRKEGQEFWNVDFPTGGNHRVMFRYCKDGQKFDKGAVAQKSLTITSLYSAPPSSYQDQSFSKYVLDLTGDYFHEEGLRRNEILPSGIGKKSLVIPHATLSSDAKREKRLNFVFPSDNFSEIKFIHEHGNPSVPQLFSNKVGGRIELPEGKTITIRIDDEEVELGRGDSFHIDNDCHTNPPENDFQRYQDIFLNKRNRDLKFQMITIDNPFAKENIEKFSEDLFEKGLEAFGIKSLVKILSDPPPIFCDPVVIGKSDGLS